MSEQNPLIPSILNVLRCRWHNQMAGAATDKPLGIHHLLAELGAHPCLVELGRDHELGLFRKNFLLMNALYQLQMSLWNEEGLLLQVSTLDIQLQIALDGADGVRQLQIADPVREYYLDWRHYVETTHEDVAILLASFWAGLDGSDRDYALRVLELDDSASRQQIRQRYQKLAGQHHPDRGGDPERFMAIRQAWETLRCTIPE